MGKTDEITWLKSDKNKSALPVAIPGAIFKIAARKDEQGAWQALAFVYPQTDASYKKRPFDPAKFLTSIDTIEKRTGEKFLTKLEPGAAVKQQVADKLWPAEFKNFVSPCKTFAPDAPQKMKKQAKKTKRKKKVGA